jgi:hypothetical protein
VAALQELRFLSAAGQVERAFTRAEAWTERGPRVAAAMPRADAPAVTAGVTERNVQHATSDGLRLAILLGGIAVLGAAGLTAGRRGRPR